MARHAIVLFEGNVNGNHQEPQSPGQEVHFVCVSRSVGCNFEGARKDARRDQVVTGSQSSHFTRQLYKDTYRHRYWSYRKEEAGSEAREQEERKEGQKATPQKERWLVHKTQGGK